MPRGMSMAPVICETDRVTIVPRTENSHIQIGNVAAVIFPGTETLVIHRIVAERRGQFLLKGDNVWRTDGYLPKAQILGYVQDMEKHLTGSAAKQNIERLLLLMEKNKRLVAFLSRSRIWTFFCRIANKIP